MSLSALRSGDYFNLFGTIPVVVDFLIPDNNYQLGGYAITGQLWGLAGTGGPAGNGILQMDFTNSRNTAGLLYEGMYNVQTGKVQILTTAGAEVAAGTDLSAMQFGVVVYAAGE